MFKVIVMVKKRPDLSHEQFIDYYDNHHVPFMHELLSKGGASVHRRNFVVNDDGPANAERYDVITEVLYKDREALDAAIRAFQDPEIARQAREDEDRFILPGSMRRIVVEVHETVFERVPESNG